MRKVAQALRILSSHDLRHPLILPDLNYEDTRVVFWENEIIRMILKLWDMEREGLTLKVVDKLAADSDALVDATPETANVNWSAVNAVHDLRWLWFRNTGKHGPARALNPASRYHAYLSDGFEFLGINKRQNKSSDPEISESIRSPQPNCRAKMSPTGSALRSSKRSKIPPPRASRDGRTRSMKSKRVRCGFRRLGLLTRNHSSCLRGYCNSDGDWDVSDRARSFPSDPIRDLASSTSSAIR